jgi:hypothetical protein
MFEPVKCIFEDETFSLNPIVLVSELEREFVGTLSGNLYILYSTRISTNRELRYQRARVSRDLI